jgi:hypothetical protein
MRHHAGEGAALHHLQTALLRSLAIVRRKRSRRSDAQIGPDQTLRLLLQRLPHAIGEQADRGETAHRQHQRQQQHAPFPGAPVAAQEIEGEAQKVHCLFTVNSWFAHYYFACLTTPC